MKKLFVLFLVPVFLTPIKIVSTEKTVHDAPSHIQYQLTYTLTNQVMDFNEIPVNPITLTDLPSYKDTTLTKLSKIIPGKTPLKIVELLINEQSLPIFKLADGTYLAASQQHIFSDISLSEEPMEVDLWLEKGFAVYQAPYYLGAKPLSTKLDPYTKVHVTRKAQTYSGTYYYINQQGWVAEKFISLVDNRMTKVQELLDSNYQKEKYAIYVEKPSTNQVAGINQDKLMYSASISKLPLLYYVQQQLDQGHISLTDKLKYIEEVNEFKGAYDPEGSGSIPKTADDKEYSVDDLIKLVAKESDNVATNILGYYVAGQYGEKYQKEMSKLPEWNMEKREVSAKTAGQHMLAIYEQKGMIIDALSNTRFDDQRISKNIDDQVAHKIGDAYDFRHDVAIVYTGEPFILSIFTENATYDDISAIAKDIYTILK